ncbi:MAG: MBL fold metallo-hydrolase, partial [Sedimentisphaerales bacterium]|nr:MBL fold metallo-hydrolase [Sedimentisphaerales bacterium]
MQAKQHYSSSAGNLYEITAANGKRLIIDPGVKWPKIQKALGYNLPGIEAAFVSHCHKDHAAAVKDAIKAGIDVYA